MSLESTLALQKVAENYADHQRDRSVALDRRISTLERQVELLIAALTTASDRATYNG